MIDLFLQELLVVRSRLHSMRKLSEHDVKRREERAALLARTGGSPGEW